VRALHLNHSSVLDAGDVEVVEFNFKDKTQSLLVKMLSNLSALNDVKMIDQQCQTNVDIDDLISVEV
jgi:hypothetical protein